MSAVFFAVLPFVRGAFRFLALRFGHLLGERNCLFLRQAVSFLRGSRFQGRRWFRRGGNGFFDGLLRVAIEFVSAGDFDDFRSRAWSGRRAKTREGFSLERLQTPSRLIARIGFEWLS